MVSRDDSEMVQSEGLLDALKEDGILDGVCHGIGVKMGRCVPLCLDGIKVGTQIIVKRQLHTQVDAPREGRHDVGLKVSAEVIIMNVTGFK